MKKLIISSTRKIAILTETDKGFILEFAVSEGVRKDFQRWIDHGFFYYPDINDRTNGPMYAKSGQENFLELVAQRAQGYNFKTEIIDEM